MSMKNKVVPTNFRVCPLDKILGWAKLRGNRGIFPGFSGASSLGAGDCWSGGGFGAPKVRYRAQNRRKSTKFVDDFEVVLLIIKELRCICTTFEAGKSLFWYFGLRGGRWSGQQTRRSGWFASLHASKLAALLARAGQLAGSLHIRQL